MTERTDSTNLARGEREPLPPRREGYIQKAKIEGLNLYIHTGNYPDGRLGKIFLTGDHTGKLLDEFATAINLGLQRGVPLEAFVDNFVSKKDSQRIIRIEGHPEIKRAASVFDYVFRALAITYLNRQDLADTIQEQQV